MMGAFIALYRAIAAFLSGIIGGFIAKVINKDIKIGQIDIKTCEDIHKDRCLKGANEHEDNSIEANNEQEEEHCCSCDHSLDVEEKGFRKVHSSIKYAFGSFVDDISLHFIIGVAIAALISTLIPDDFFGNLGLNNGLLAMLLMIVIGLPMYICSTSSIPIAIALILKGISPGAAFVFLFVGPITNIASILLLGKTLGKKATITYLITVILLAIIFGLLMDLLINIFNINLEVIGQQMHESSSAFMIVVAVLFAFILLMSIIRRIKRKFSKVG